MPAQEEEAFSLVQVVFALAVIALIMAISVAGISILRESSRESNRKTLGNNLAIELNNYKKQNLRYPTPEQVEFTDSSILIDGKVVQKLSAELKSSLSTDSNGTRYHYSNISGGFALCALRESGRIESFGNQPCPDLESW